MKGLFALAITVGVSALIWVAVQDWYESRRSLQSTLAASKSPGTGPL